MREYWTYKELFENTLTNLQDLTNALILKHMVSSNSENMGDKFFPMVEKINSLEKFKVAINNSMKFLDSK